MPDTNERNRGQMEKDVFFRRGQCPRTFWSHFCATIGPTKDPYCRVRCRASLAHLSVEVVSFAQELAHLSHVASQQMAGRGDEVPTMFMSSPGVWRRNLEVAIPPTATTGLGVSSRYQRLTNKDIIMLHHVTFTKTKYIKSCVFRM